MSINPFGDLVPGGAFGGLSGREYMNANRAERGLAPITIGMGIPHNSSTQPVVGAPVAAAPPGAVPVVAPPAAVPPAALPPAALPPAASAAPAMTPQQAMEQFANSAGMQFQMAQGANAINNLYAAKGALQSGSAMKALQDYGQNTALQNYFMPYMSMLNGQQAMGAQAGSSIAGVGSSFGNTAAGINSGYGNAATAINGQIGGAYQNSADAAANAAIASGAGQAQLWGAVGSGLGTLGSSFVPRPGY